MTRTRGNRLFVNDGQTVLQMPCLIFEDCEQKMLDSGGIGGLQITELSAVLSGHIKSTGVLRARPLSRNCIAHSANIFVPAAKKNPVIRNGGTNATAGAGEFRIIVPRQSPNKPSLTMAAAPSWWIDWSSETDILDGDIEERFHCSILHSPVASPTGCLG